MPFTHDILIIILGTQNKIVAFKEGVTKVQDNWDNLNQEQQEAVEDIFDDFVAWTTIPASYPGANVKLEQMTAELEPFQ